MNGEVTTVVSKVAHNRRFRLVVAGLIIIILVLGLLIVPVEVRNGRGGNIGSVEDGIWWVVTTMTGVGYGDKYPVTTTGRIIGMVVEIFGVVLFGSIVAIVSVELMRNQDDFYTKRLLKRMEELEQKIDQMRKKLDFVVKTKMEE